MNFEAVNPTTPKPSAPTGTGYLVMHVTTARGAIPLEGAQVSIRTYLPGKEPDRGDLIATLVSGRDGNTPTIPLSAPPKSNSQKPGGQPPYSSYIAEISLEGFYEQSYTGIPIFDGITAIQPVEMIPLPENGQTDSFTPDGMRFFESEAPNL